MRSWLRLIDPDRPSPLASLALDIAGAEAYLRGTRPATRRRSGCMPTTAPATLVVDLVRPATDFVNIVAGPTLRGRPARASGTSAAALTPGQGLRGEWRLRPVRRRATTGLDPDRERRATGRVKPAITTIELVSDLGGRSAVDAFAAGDLDYTSVFGIDASWLAYDETLGPQLRLVDSLSVQYYGFDVTKAPFDDPLRPAGVRRRPSTGGGWRR